MGPFHERDAGVVVRVDPAAEISGVSVAPIETDVTTEFAGRVETKFVGAPRHVSVSQRDACAAAAYGVALKRCIKVLLSLLKLVYIFENRNAC